MIGVEWGSNLFRAWRFASDGAIRDSRSAPRGLLSVPNLRFSDTLREELGRWIAGGEDRVLICGPLGIWRSAPPVQCPCGAAEIASALFPVPFDWAKVRLVPPIRYADPEAAGSETGVGETGAGEETRLLGAAAAIGGNGLLCLPGPLSCWARFVDGRVTALSTFLTGEAFAALRGPLLGRATRDAPLGPPGFDDGVARAGDPGGLLRQLAALRAEAAHPDAAARLFGLLVGHEVRAALTLHEEVHLVGAAEPCALYARAIAANGGTALPPARDTVADGLALIGAAADWT